MSAEFISPSRSLHIIDQAIILVKATKEFKRIACISNLRLASVYGFRQKMGHTTQVFLLVATEEKGKRRGPKLKRDVKTPGPKCERACSG